MRIFIFLTAFIFMDTLVQLTGAVDSLGTPSESFSSVYGFLQTEGIVGQNWLILMTLFFRFLIIIRIIKDANYRSSSLGFLVLSLLLVTLFTPFLGLPIYRAIRPKGYKHERAYWKAIMTADYEDYEENSGDNYTVKKVSQKTLSQKENIQQEDLSKKEHTEKDLKKQETKKQKIAPKRKTPKKRTAPSPKKD